MSLPFFIPTCTRTLLYIYIYIYYTYYTYYRSILLKIEISSDELGNNNYINNQIHKKNQLTDINVRQK